MAPSRLDVPSPSGPESWEIKVSAKRAAAAALIPAEWRLPASIDRSGPNVMDIPRSCGLLTPAEIIITESFDAHELLSQLASGVLSSVEVTTAFSKRAAIAQQLINCLTETFFPEALSRAAELDEHRSRTGLTVGPLHGLPISIKDVYNISGVPSTVGLVSFLDHKAPTSNAALVEILLKAGAVLYVKTNVPQTLSAPESHNNVFGRTLNPHNVALSVGGSSGGEGALIAIRGSPLGIGTDLAGSVRIPAFCCGLVSVKTTVNRLPFGGQTTGHREGGPVLIPSSGPIAHSIRDAELLIKAVFNGNVRDVDASALGVPWREPEASCRSVLRIGVMHEDLEVPLHPPMVRTMMRAIQKLEAAGHEIIDITAKAPRPSVVSRTMVRYLSLEPSGMLLNPLMESGEPMVPSLAALLKSGKPRRETTLSDVYDMSVQTAKHKAEMNKVWNDERLDVVLCPAYQGGCAQPHDSYGSKELYTGMWNLLDYPACTLPFGRAEKNADADSKFSRSLNYEPPYSPDMVEGMPCHVQLVTRTLMDEELLRHATEVERVLNL